MITYTKATKKNLRFLYNSERGNLYFRRPGKKKVYEVCEGFSYDELYQAMCAGECELIWIEGPSLGTNVEVD